MGSKNSTQYKNRTYLDFIPVEIIEIIASYVDDRTLSSLSTFIPKGRVNWDVVYLYKFGHDRKKLDYEEYSKILSFLRFKKDYNIVNIDETIEIKIISKGISKLEPEIFSLYNLRKLDLSDNELTHFPLGIEDLHNLVKLNLSGNKLSDIKGITGLINLEELDLSKNNFSKLSEEIGQLRNIKKLWLHHNRFSKINSIPVEILKLTKLKLLDLANNGLKVIPPVIFGMSNLKRLKLSVNYISEIPSDIKRLTKLKSLELSVNLLMRIPCEIAELRNLEKLDLTDNHISEYMKDEIRYWFRKRDHLKIFFLSKDEY